MLNLLTVVGENIHMLPHMIKHYKENIGVDNVFVVVYKQENDDNIVNEILDLGIQPYAVYTHRKYDWAHVTKIYNEVKSSRPNDWWIISDDDELQLYPEPIDDIIKTCERKNYSFVTGGFLDRIGKNGTFPVITPDSDIHELFPNAGWFRYILSSANMNKCTLSKGSLHVSPGQHYAEFADGGNSWGKSHPSRYPTQECFAQVHHFKWDNSCIKRIKKVADLNQDYAYSEEYKRLYDNLKLNNFKIDLNNKNFLFEEIKHFNYNSYYNWDKVRRLTIKM